MGIPVNKSIIYNINKRQAKRHFQKSENPTDMYAAKSFKGQRADEEEIQNTGKTKWLNAEDLPKKPIEEAFKDRERRLKEMQEKERQERERLNKEQQ